MMIVQVYSLLAMFALGIFGAVHIISANNSQLGYVEFAGSFIMFINIWVLRVFRNLRAGRNVFLLTVFVFMGLMLVTGGIGHSGIFWFFVFPVSAFFMVGKWQGVAWMSALVAMVFILWILGLRGSVQFAYRGATITQLLASLTAVSIGIYAYQDAREQLASQTRTARRSLQNERVRADEIIEQIDEGVIATDSTGKVTYVNRVAEAMLGWRSAELHGKNFIAAVPMLDSGGQPVAAETRPLQHALERAASTSMVATYRRKNGKSLPVSVTSSPLLLDGKVIGAVGMFRDISEEQTLGRAKSEFLTLASHQLRTPISEISWIVELLLSGDSGKLTPEQRSYIEDVYRSTRQLSTIVSEMLIESSLELEGLAVNPEPTDVASLASEIVKEQTAIRKIKRPHITEEYDSDIAPLNCDREIVRLILRNLISNAIKYSPIGKPIVVSVKNNPEAKVVSGSQGSVVITVQDHGFGIPAPATDKIFSRFFRAANIIHKDTNGTGLGLYIVKRLLDYVGGRVSFVSREGKGTTFTVALPLEGMQKRQPNNPVSAGAALSSKDSDV